MNSESGKLKSKTLRLTLCLYLLMLFYAFSVTMTAPMMPVLIEQYSLNLGEGGLFMTFQSIGGILAIVCGGLVADRMKKSLLVSFSFIAYSLCLFFMGLSPSFDVLLAMFFILGASTKLLDTILNAYVSDLHRENRGVFMTTLHTFFGIGALLGPLYSRVLLNKGVLWGNTFRILGVICLAIMVLYLVVLRGTPENHKEQGQAASNKQLKYVFSLKMLLLCIIMILYRGHQSGINTWLPMYLEDVLKADAFSSSLALSIFWVGLIAARLLSPKLTGLMGTKQLLLWGNLLGGAILVCGILSNNPLILIISTGITGLLTGATMPLLLVLGCEWYPENSGTASSMLYLSSTLSTMFFPWIIGTVGEATNFKWGMLITGITLVATLAFILPLMKKDSQKTESLNI